MWSTGTKLRWTEANEGGRASASDAVEGALTLAASRSEEWIEAIGRLVPSGAWRPGGEESQVAVRGRWI